MTAIGPIGWIGLGAMGLPMARRLVDGGVPLSVWARRPIDPTTQTALGDPPIAKSPKQLAASCPIVCTIIGGPPDVAAIYRGPDGLLSGVRRDSILIDHTTSSPELARELALEASQRGADILDAPVSGGPGGAATGRLTMMVGGQADALSNAHELLEMSAATIVHHGGAGMGQAAKLANQALVAGSMLAIAEARRIGQAAGLDDERVRQTLESGIAGSALLSFAWERAQVGDRRPGFAIDHLIKDLSLTAELVPAESIELVAMALNRYRALAMAGHGAEGTQVLLFDEETRRAT